MKLDLFARATARLLLLLAVVAVPAGLYLFVVVKQQAASLNARNLRLVSEVGAQLDDRLIALAQIAERLTPPPALQSETRNDRPEYVEMTCPLPETVEPGVRQSIERYCKVSGFWAFLEALRARESQGDPEEIALKQLADQTSLQLEALAASIAQPGAAPRLCPLRNDSVAIAAVEPPYALDLASCDDSATPEQLWRAWRRAHEASERNAEIRTAAGIFTRASSRVSRLEMRMVEAAIRERGLLQPTCVANAASLKGDERARIAETFWSDLEKCQPVPSRGDPSRGWRAAVDRVAINARTVGSRSFRRELERLEDMAQTSTLRQSKSAPEAPVAWTAEQINAIDGVFRSDLTATDDAVRSSGLAQLKSHYAASCRDDTAVCIIPDNRSASREQVIAQLRTNDWARSLDFRDMPDCKRAAKTKTTISLEPGALPMILAMKCAGTEAIAGAADEPSGQDLALQVPLADLVQPVPADSGLYALLLADCDGSVLTAHTREISITGAAPLFPSAQTKAGDKSNPPAPRACSGATQSWVLTDVDVAGIPTRVFGHPFKPSKFSSGEALAEGETAKPQTGGHWFLIGLQAQSDFNAETRVLPFELVATLAPLVLIALLGWPCLYIALSGARTSFGRGAPVWFAVATVYGAGLVTIVGLGLYAYKDVGMLRDDMLARVANEVTAKLDRELRDTLNLFSKSASGQMLFNAPNGDDRNGAAAPEAQGEAGGMDLAANGGDGAAQSQADRESGPIHAESGGAPVGVAYAMEACSDLVEGSLSSRQSDRRCFGRGAIASANALLGEYSSFEFAFELDEAGNQVGPHLSLRSAAVSRDPLATRAYFQRALRGLLVELPLGSAERTTGARASAAAGAGAALAASAATDSQPFAIEQIRSRDFGWALSSIAVPVKQPVYYETDRNRSAVTVIIKRLQTLFAPILPAGVSIAVVRNRAGSAALDGSAADLGDVLVHSNDSRSLIENLLTETDGNRDLAGAIAGVRTELVDVTYRGDPYRFHTSPIEGLPWTLVVMYEKDFQRVFTWRNILTASAAFLSYMFIATIVVALTETQIHRMRLPYWLWPSRRNAGLHLVAAFALAVIGAILVSGAGDWGGPGRPWHAVWLVLLGSAFSIYGLLTLHFEAPRRGQTRSSAARLSTSATAHATVAGSLWLRVRTNAFATATCSLGIALLAASTFPTGSIASLALIAAVVAVFCLPTRGFTVKPRSDVCYVVFVATLIATISIIPASMLFGDSYAFHREGYEKHNVEHVALAGMQRREALQNELRRLQPSTFDRPAVRDVEPDATFWCRGFYGAGAMPADIVCPSAHAADGADAADAASAAAAPVADTAADAGADTIDVRRAISPNDEPLRSATSWFSTQIRTPGLRSAIFSDGWRWRRDDGSVRWSFIDEGSLVTPRLDGRFTVDAGDTFGRFAPAADGLFDSEPESSAVARLFAADVVVVMSVVLALIAAVALTWRALAIVTDTFFGSFALRSRLPRRDAKADWAKATADERHLLRHLAQGLFVNCSRNQGTIGTLLQKGLVEFAPGLQIVDDHVAEQARTTPRTAAEQAFEREQPKGAWSEIRMPFFAILGLAAIVIVVATPDALRSAMGALAASATGVGVIVQIVNLLMRSRQ